MIWTLDWGVVTYAYFDESFELISFEPGKFSLEIFSCYDETRRLHLKYMSNNFIYDYEEDDLEIYCGGSRLYSLKVMPT